MSTVHAVALLMFLGFSLIGLSLWLLPGKWGNEVALVVSSVVWSGMVIIMLLVSNTL